MKHYIFYTSDGDTYDNSGKEIENCQVVGWEKGKNPKEAFCVLIKNNPFLKDFDFETCVCQEIIGKTEYFYF